MNDDGILNALPPLAANGVKVMRKESHSNGYNEQSQEWNYQNYKISC